MKTLLFAIKLVAALVGGSLLLVVLFVAGTLIRKSVPIVFRSDLEQLVASGAYNDSALASEICGAPVTMLVSSPAPKSPGEVWAEVTLHSWRPFFLGTGTLSARVSGVGVDHQMVPVTGRRCAATITFSYRCAWVDNGRAYTQDMQFVGKPQVVRTP